METLESHLGRDVKVNCIAEVDKVWSERTSGNETLLHHFQGMQKHRAVIVQLQSVSSLLPSSCSRRRTERIFTKRRTCIYHGEAAATHCKAHEHQSDALKWDQRLFLLVWATPAPQKCRAANCKLHRASLRFQDFWHSFLLYAACPCYVIYTFSGEHKRKQIIFTPSKALDINAPTVVLVN